MPRRDTDINLWTELHRRRHGLGPFYIMALLACSGLLGRQLELWELGTLAGAFAAAGAARIHRRVRKAWRRAYAYTVLTAMIVWVGAVHTYVPDPIAWSTAGVLLVAGTLLGGIPWWSSETRLHQVRMEQKLRDWPRLAKRISRPGLAMGQVVGTTFGFKGKFHWPGGLYSVKEIMNSAESIEGALGAQRGALSLVQDGGSTNSVLWELAERDPHVLPQDWTIPTRVGRAADPVQLGPFKDGKTAEFRRYVKGVGIRHMLIGGAPGSGKSGAVNLIVGTNVCSDDIATVGMDFKGGLELGPWADTLEHCIKTPAEAEEFLVALAAPGGGLDERAAIIADTGQRVWDTEIHGPILCIVVDELRELLGSCSAKTLNAFISVSNKGRALGVEWVLATQYPTVEAIGSTQNRQAIPIRLCFRMEDETGEGYVLNTNARVRANEIPSDRQGTSYLQDGEVLYTKTLRVSWVSDNAVKTVVEERRGRTATVDERTDAAIARLSPAWANRARWVDPEDAEAIEREQERESERERARSAVHGTVNPAGGTVNESVSETGAAVHEEGSDGDVAELLAARRARLSPDERAAEDHARERELTRTVHGDVNEGGSVHAMLCALAAAGDAGMAPKDLQAVACKSSSWFFAEAKKLEKLDGSMRRTKHGTWVMPAEHRGRYLALSGN